MRRLLPTVLAGLFIATPLAAQLSVGGVEAGIPPVGGVLGDVTEQVDRTAEQTTREISRQAQRLLRARDRAIGRLLRRNRDRIDVDVRGNLARRGVLLAQDLTEKDRIALMDAGFAPAAREEIEGLDFAVYRLDLPDGMKLAEAQALASALAPDAEFIADNLHFQTGTRAGSAGAGARGAQSAIRIGTQVGIIDGAPGSSVRVLGERGFASGAPRPSDHGTAVASLLAAAGVERIRVADVYGNDPAGGNALAIARALGWLTASGSKVVNISLVGPRNALVERAVAAARAKGIIVIAAVGNDGPAAPPAYPASYAGVIAVTGVDRRNRVLIEAGRALDLDYAAPGADVYAHDMGGRLRRWRGTSFAAPLAAARAAAAMEKGGNWRARLDAEARDLGKKGPDEIYGRGLLCENCARKK